jgi:hypothetical protein
MFLRATSTSVVARGYYCCCPRLLVFLPAAIVLEFACRYYCLCTCLQLSLPAVIFLLPAAAVVVSSG